MARYGLGNFVYDHEVRDGKSVFNFFDPEDTENTATVEIAPSEFPEGVTKADARQVADLAYAQCQKVLNDKRDARLHQEASDDLEAKQTQEAEQREAAADFLNNSQELANTTPTGSEPKTPKEKKAPAHNEKSQDSEPGTEEDQEAAKKSASKKDK